MSAGRYIDAWEPTIAQRRARDAVARAFGIEPVALVGRSRKRDFVRARHAAVWVVKQRWPALSWPMVARVINMGDHSTAIYAFRRAEDTRAREPLYRAATDALLAGLPPPAMPRAAVAARAAHRKPAEPSDPLARAPGTWCHQCDQRVGGDRVAGCRDRFCSLKDAASRAVPGSAGIAA